MWYNVGSKDEPKGKTGFAHLFEHLMFNGSENLPGDFFEYLQQIGATDYNGTTDFDRTNYFQTVPTGALERALFMESDRMGYLLGAVTQGIAHNLNNLLGVVIGYVDLIKAYHDKPELVKKNSQHLEDAVGLGVEVLAAVLLQVVQGPAPVEVGR